MCLFFLVSYEYDGVVVGGTSYSFQYGGGVDGRGNFRPPLFSPGFQLLSPQSYTFSSSLTACDGVVYKPKKFKGETGTTSTLRLGS